jgi:hypothetical protein
VRDESQQATLASKHNISQIKDKQIDDKRRIVLLSKQIATTETAILNSQGYTKIVEAESQHKTLLKEIKE